METFSASLAICAGNFPHNGQWRGALMFSLICAWINDWVNNREAGDLRRQHGHYDVIVMFNPHHGNIITICYTTLNGKIIANIIQKMKRRLKNQRHVFGMLNQHFVAGIYIVTLHHIGVKRPSHKEMATTWLIIKVCLNQARLLNLNSNSTQMNDIPSYDAIIQEYVEIVQYHEAMKTSGHLLIAKVHLGN